MTTQSELSREWITQALYELLKMKSFSSITNKEITDKAGLSHITIYRLFDSKEEIILKDLKTRIRKSFLKEYHIADLFDFYQSNQELIDCLYQNHLSN
ncbi:TetR/AcrR family transcriptional regulator [Dubosiella newyorkensis]|uniref:TetR/AcrR family transcriptional regulator n=1 Tax=Dubosiella newyorkensis TaxID=1862672 RepID=UPI0027316823|nr:TetR/AcrR family transcriptional regulator [Dubosiella newyorkensis]